MAKSLSLFTKNLVTNLASNIFSKFTFDSYKVRSGEEADPDTFNRTVFGSMEAESKLSAGLANISRSSSLGTLENTQLLVHFDSSKKFVEAAQSDILESPFTILGDTNIVTHSISRFKGAFIPTANSGNIVASSPLIDSSLQTIKGWSLIGNTEAQCTVKSTSIGLNFKNYIKGGSSAIGGLRVETTPKLTLDSTVVDLGKISLALTVNSRAFDEAYGTTYHMGVKFYKSDDTLISTATKDISRAENGGVIRFSNISIPALAVKIQPYFEAKINKIGTKLDFDISNAIVVGGPHIGGYTGALSSGTGVLYNSVVDTSIDALTISSWVTFNKEYLTGTGLTRSSSILGVMDSTNLVIVIIKNGSLVLNYYNYVTDTLVASSDEIALPDISYDVPCFLVFRKSSTLASTDRHRIEALLWIDNDLPLSIKFNDVDPVSSPLNVKLYNGKSSLLVGTPISYTNDYSNFEGEITEVRVDNEWLNDEELKTMWLSRTPYVNNTTKQALITESDVSSIINSVGVNKLVNPDGRLRVNHWSGYPMSGINHDRTKFDAIVNDPTIGSGFIWKGGSAGSDYFIESEFISIDVNQKCKFRGKVESLMGSIGHFGLGIRFYTDKNKANKVGSDFIANALEGTGLATYSLDVEPPSNALYATAVIYVGFDTSSTRITWSRLKFEQGDAFTVFSDDASYKYALYAPKRGVQ